MLRTLAGLLLCVMATGCATMVNGSHQTLSVDSYPSGAAIQVDCGHGPKAAGPTPVKLKVSRAANRCQLTFTREGYEPRAIELSHQTSRATVLNAAFGVPSAIVLGIAGAILGAPVNGSETGAQMGAEAGLDLGSGGVTALDKKIGGWKWVPARVFVVLSRSDQKEPPASE